MHIGYYDDNYDDDNDDDNDDDDDDNDDDRRSWSLIYDTVIIQQKKGY